MSKLNRRNILKGGIGIGAGLLVTNPISAFDNKSTARIRKNEGDSYASIVKHGRPKGDNLMVWSLAKFSKQTEVTQVMRELRERHSYRTRLKYSSNDRYKIPICEDLISYVSENGDIEFQVVAFENYNEITRGLSPMQFQQRLLNVYNRLSMGGLAQVDIKAEDNFGPSQEFVDNVKNLNGYSLNTVSTRDTELLQLNDLISGLFYATLSEKQPNGNTKQTLIRMFRERFRLGESRPKGGTYGNINFEFAEL